MRINQRTQRHSEGRTTRFLRCRACAIDLVRAAYLHRMELQRSEEHTSELQSHRDLHSFPTRRSSDLRTQRHSEGRTTRFLRCRECAIDLVRAAYLHRMELQ